MAAAPAFASTPNVGVGNFSAANTARDGTGSITTVFTPGASGSRLNRIVVKAEDDFADGIVILWLKVGGATWFLWKEIDTGDGANADNTTPGYEYELSLSDRDINLPSGCLVGATITVAPTTGDCNVFAFGGDY